MIAQQYKIDIIMNLVFIILGPFLKNIKFIRLILVTNIFKSA